ncbi:lysozyme [Aurantiacibacter xanthus]|uniref:Lysozyme n=1 Tax=Aurantiacibacter xanthus TaxID=1784712 RepID=A0A3A1PG76_9SPHN|nr:lysozyme [Aurantiacibacter xanthus]
MARKRKRPWRLRALAALLLVALAAGGWLWWQSRTWRPERTDYPVQGALIGERDGVVDFGALDAAGADFVYLEASAGDNGRDAQFSRNLEALAGKDMPYGAVHEYDPCVPAERQSANFVTIVPRDARMLPPVIALGKLPSACGNPAIEAGLESELTTFINQVENHTGQPVVLLVPSAFEAKYGISRRIERNLWLTRDWFQPDYAGRPWTLWTANAHLHSALAAEPLRWVVVQP